MKKLLHLLIGTTVIQFADTADSNAIINGLSAATFYDKDWNSKLTEKAETVTFEFVNPDNTSMNPAVAAALAEKEQYSQYWQSSNKERDKLKAELAELTTKFDVLSARLLAAE